MITLAPSATLRAIGGTGAANITFTLNGDAIASGTDAFQTLAQGSLSTSVTTIYTATAVQALIDEVLLANTSGSDVTGVIFYVNGNATTNQISGTITIPANGTVIYSKGSWKVFSSSGILLSTIGGAAGGDLTGSYPNPTIATSAVTNAKMANMAAHTFKGNNTAGSSAPLDLTQAQLTADLNAATTALQGMQSATDKKKEDNMYYDVTANSIATLVGDDSTDNSSLWTTFFAGLPTGATVYFPAGTYRTSAEFAISADKHLRIVGAGMYSTTIKTTSTTANIFHINGSYWYNTFEQLRFDSTVTKTAGAAIAIDPGASGSAIGTNINRCSFINQFYSINAQGAQAANLSVWDALDISTTPVNGRGILINGSTVNLALTNSTINCGYPPFQVAGTACIEIQQSGAVQIVGCEVIGGINTLLLNANQGGSTSIAAVYATNTFFDQSGGSTVKITGANVVNRCKFVQCGITGGNIATPIAVEVASTGTGAAGTATAAADGINFIDCDIYPNGGSGTMDGFKITGAQGVSIQSSRISGWTNGIEVTPAAANGYTKIFISDNKMGATNNFTTPNTVGLLLNAGSFQYGNIEASGNDFSGSTTAITDNSTLGTTGQKIIDGNLGLPLGSVRTTQLSATTVTQITNAVIPAGSLRVGTTWRVNGYFNRATSDTGATTIIVTIGTAGTTGDGTVVSVAPVHTAVANQAGYFDFLVTCRAIGAATTSFTGSGISSLSTNNTNVATTPVGNFWRGLGATLGSLTSSNTMFIGVNIAHATNAVTVDNCVIEVLAQ